jgi:LmbE family N-acetylglucosaminyl deacetylase
LSGEKFIKKLIICFVFTIFYNNVLVMNIGGTKRIGINPITRKINYKKIIDIYYIPHPDDETLSMGIAIADSVYKGHEVYLILLSQGFDSNVRNIINGKEFCKWHKKYHSPKKEGYKQLSYYEFGMLRQKEFLNAALDLGVSQKKIRICNFLNGKFNELDIEKIVLEYEKKYPNAFHNTTSFYDYNKTHKKLAKTLLRLYKLSKIKHVKFYLSPDKWSKTKGILQSNSHINRRVVKGISAYCTWNPTKLSYALGYHSVEVLFRLVRIQLVSKYNTYNKL